MWTADELRVLREMWARHGGRTSEWEVRIPGRTDNAVRVQARRMGLARPKSHTGMSTRQRDLLLRGFRVLCGKVGCSMRGGMVELCRMDERGML